MLKIAFDIGGVISKYPELFRKLLDQLTFGSYCSDNEFFILTDMHPIDNVKETLRLNDFLKYFDDQHILIADYDTYGEAAKAVLCKKHKISIFIDDFIGYLGDNVGTLRLLVMPDSKKPYWADSWKVTDNHDFGRRKYDPD